MRLAALDPQPFESTSGFRVGGVFVCFARGGEGPGAPGDLGWAGAALMGQRHVRVAVAQGVAGAAYEPGFLALREGPLLESAVRSLAVRPDLLLVNATGRDHPRRAGLAVHLGAVVGIPTVGVTNRALVASGSEPGERRFDRSPLILDGEAVGYVMRTHSGTRPLLVHAGWQTTPDTAAEIVERVIGRYRTPEPIRKARTIARRARGGY